MAQIVFSIDPGSVHCGTAWWEDGECKWTREYTPYGLFQLLNNWMTLKSGDVVVMEEFRLYPWKSAEQGFSQLKTVETIGVVRWIVGTKWSGAVELIEQPALIKKPTMGQMRARGVTNLATEEKTGGHCADAFLHGWYYLNNPKAKEK